MTGSAISMPSGAPVRAWLDAFGVAAGSSVSGFITFESATPDSYPGMEGPDLDTARFLEAITDAGLTLAGGSLSPTPYVGPSDRTRLMFAGESLAPDAAGSFLWSDESFVDPSGRLLRLSSSLMLEAPDPLLFAGNVLPVNAPALELLYPYYGGPLIGGTVLVVSGGDGTTDFTASAELVRLHQVPEPDGWALVALALLSVRYPRRR